MQLRILEAQKVNCLVHTESTPSQRWENIITTFREQSIFMRLGGVITKGLIHNKQVPEVGSRAE